MGTFFLRIRQLDIHCAGQLHIRLAQFAFSVAHMRSTIALGALLLSAVGCTDNSTDSSKSAASATTASNAAGSAASRSTAGPSIEPGGTLTGTLREQIPVGPYVYVRLETPSGETWAAVNESKLTIGDRITVYNVMLMEQFNSPTLGRTFDRIYFGSLDAKTGDTLVGSASVPEAAGTAAPGGAVTTVGAPAATDAKVGNIAKATGVNARTISELWSQKSELAGKPVSVRGVVVKYNASVMGKNWIHLQDGTGSAGNGTLDITATSQSTVTVGDTVTVTGMVRLNRDFGAGYSYPLLLDDARVVR